MSTQNDCLAVVWPKCFPLIVPDAYRHGIAFTFKLIEISKYCLDIIFLQLSYIANHTTVNALNLESIIDA